MNEHPLPLCELLRPKCIQEFILPERQRKVLNRFMQSGTVMNLIFHGRSGIGKTSAARFLSQDFDVFQVDGHRDKGVKTINEIREFASTLSLVGKRKLCLIDEADGLSQSLQDSLRGEIENNHNCRFVLTTNNLDGITEPIKSRCTPLSFNVTPNEWKEMQPQVIVAYEQKLMSLNIPFESELLGRIIDAYAPDYRAIANRIELEF